MYLFENTRKYGNAIMIGWRAKWLSTLPRQPKTGNLP